MDDTLKRLLEAEKRAERIVEEGRARREELARRAVEDARSAEAHFAARAPEIHSAFMDKAKARAEQTVAELELRYEERKRELRETAASHREEAVEAAMALITGHIRG